MSDDLVCVFDQHTMPVAGRFSSGARPATGSAHSEQYSLLPYALDLAARGFRVFPCCAKQKKPHEKGGWKRATTKPDIIRKCWARWPDADIGFGLRRNELVIDEDGPEGMQQFLDLLRQLGPLPLQKAVARTGGEGVHHYFRLPDDVANLPDDRRILNWNGQLASKIDIKTIGGLVIAPPSCHKSGGRYRWVDDCPKNHDDLPELPTRWVEHILGLRGKPKKAPSDPAGHEAAPGSENAKEIPEKAFPWAEEPEGAEPVTDEAFRAFVSQACYRFPIRGPGERNQQQALLLAHFLGVKHLPGYQVRRIGHAWLSKFEDKMGTPLEQAKAEQDRHLDRTLQNPNFRPVETDPLYWSKLLSSFLPPASPKTGVDKRVSWVQGEGGLCRTDEERMFVEFLICHARLEQARGRHDRFPLTNQQIVDGLEQLFGDDFKNKEQKAKQLKKLFISTLTSKTKSGKESPAKKATREELLVREIVGFTGRPSEYRITGLAKLLQETKDANAD